MHLTIKDVSKSFKHKNVIDSFSMALQPGDCVGLIGPNGAGKSTLMKMIANIIDPDEGSILFNDMPHTNMKKDIGYLPQFPSFFPWMTAKETLFFMGQLSGLEKKDLAHRIPEMLTKVGLKSDMHTKIGTFSGGMKQRLGIAHALLHRPSFLLLDEPVSALDPIGRREVLHLISDIKHDTTILLSTHILADAEETCNRFAMIKDGMKVKDTTLTDMLNEDTNSRIHIKTARTPKEWVTKLKQFAFIQHIECNGSHLLIDLHDIHQNKNLLLRSALQNNIDLVTFEIYNKTLEETFIDEVTAI